MVSGRLHLRHSQFCHIADGKWIQTWSTTPLSLTFIISKDESRFRTSVGPSVYQSCWDDGQIFVRSILFCGNDNQIFVWSVWWGRCPDFCLVCPVGLMPRFLFGLSCAADDEILSGQSCLVAMITRFLSGLSCTADDQIFARSVLSCGADTQIFVWSVLWGWWTDFYLVSLVLRQLWPDFCLVSCGADDQISAYILNNAVILLWGILSGERRLSVRCRMSPSLSQALIYILPHSAVVLPYFTALKIM